MTRYLIAAVIAASITTISAATVGDQSSSWIESVLMEYGFAGLFFILFFFERKDRIAAESEQKKHREILVEALDALKDKDDDKQVLVQLVKENTDAVRAMKQFLEDDRRGML